MLTDASAPLRCAFLSMSSLADFVCDDDHALAPFEAAGITVRTVSWHARDVNWDDFDLVIVRSTWDYQHHLQAFFAALALIDTSRAVLANPLSVLRWNASKHYLQGLPGAGVPCVPSRFGATLTADALTQLQREFGRGRWVIKPQVGANAGDTFVLGGPADAETGTVLERFSARAWLAQPFVDSVCEDGEYSLFYFNGQYSHAIRKTPAAGDFRVQEEHGGEIVACSPEPSLLEAGACALAALPETCLYARIDLVRGATRQWQVMELELIEPSLYLRTDPEAATRFARQVRPWLHARED